MDLNTLAILAIVQGLTEFLPISSSGHLALVPALSGGVDQGPAIDVAAHVGSLGAVMLFFRREVAMLFRGAFQLLRGKASAPEARLLLLLALATIPVLVAGLALKLSGHVDALRSVAVIGWATLIGGVILWICDRFFATEREMTGWGLRDALIMGAAQAVALIPGTSRSGATIAAARALGFERGDAARIAMLMSIPTIIAAGALLGLDALEQGDVAFGRDAAIVAALSFVSALVSLVFLMRMLRSWSLTPFAIYRLALGTGLLLYTYL